MRRFAYLFTTPSSVARRFAVLATTLLLAFTSIGVGAASPAPILASVTGGWYHNAATNHDYARVDGLTWAEAEAYAVSLGGHLVTINDGAEQAWLSTTFPEPEFALGFNDRAVEGTWVWSSGEPVTYTAWTSGEPNDANEGEDVAFMNWVDPNGNIGWNDMPDNGPVSSIVEVASDSSLLVFVPDDAATIAGALALVAAGGTVHVRPGTYAGGFVIDKPVTLEGEGWDQTVIDGGSSAVAITVQTNGATLASFKVVAVTPTIGIRLISASQNTLDHVWTDGGRFGVSFYAGANDNVVVDSRASNAAEWGFDGGDTGSIRNSYRRVEAWGDQGGIVAYANSNGTTVIDSNLHHNGVGFMIGWSSGWSVTGTTMTHNQNGLTIDTSWSGTAFDNDIIANVDGVEISGLGSSGNTIRANRIRDNSGNGVHLATAATSNLIVNNIISGNGVGARVNRNDETRYMNLGNTFHHNTFAANTVNAIAAEERSGGNTWDNGYPSGGNSWDDAIGADAFSGPAQDIPGSDGIIDAPRAIAGGADVDRYPLVSPPAPEFRFTVDRGYGSGFGFIDGQQFMPGQEITISLNGTPIGTQRADPDGHFWLDFPEGQDPPIELLPGDTVAVSAGGATKTTVVTNLQVQGVEGNVISGIADTSWIQLWVWDSPVNRHVPVVDGHWSVDVGTPDGPGETDIATLGPGSGISAEELDEDGDGTQADYQVPNPRFSVLPDDDTIHASGFTPGTDLRVSRDGAAIETEGTTFGPDGDAWFWSPVDLAPGDTIVVGDGTLTKTVLVTHVAITGTAGNVISGRADGDEVEVWVAETDVHRFIAVGTDGSWSVDVGTPGGNPDDWPTTTLVPGSHLGAQEFDEDGDRTEVEWWIPNPRIHVDPADGWINGVEFPVGAPVTIELNGQTVVDGSLTVEDNGEIWFEPEAALHPGDAVAVSAGGVSKSTVVTDLTVASVVGNVISGHADGLVHLWVDSTDCNRTEQAGPDGAWSIDVSIPGDDGSEQMTLTLVSGSSGGVEQSDEDGDATQAHWRVPNPTFQADTVEDWIHGDQFGDGVVVTITDPKTGSERSWSGEAINYDEVWFDLDLNGADPWDLAPGQTVTIAGSAGTRSLVLADLTMTGYDLDANTVSGTADRPGWIAVEIDDADPAPRVELLLESAGDWVVDFDDEGYDLKLLDTVRISEADEAWNSTTIGRTTLAPARFVFSPVVQDVVGSDWPTGVDVTLTIDRPSTEASPDFVATSSVGIDCNERDSCPVWLMPKTGTPNVFFNLSIGPFQARPGDVMTMTSGSITKVMTVPDITVGVGEDDVLWTDDDADQTWVPAPRPYLAMDPAADRVWVSDLAGAGDVTLTVERGGTTVHAQTVHTTNVLTRGEWLLDMWAQPTGIEPRPAVALFDLGAFDLRAGDVVTVADGTSTLTRTVAALTIDRIDPDADTVAGTGTPGVEVALHLGEGADGFWGYNAIPDGNGDWSFHFDPDQFPFQGLDPGMIGEAIVDQSTIVFWKVPDGQPGTVTVSADDLTVDYGAALPPLTWTASGLHAGDAWTTEPTCTTTAGVGSPVGTYPITCSGGAADGYSVDYENGTLWIVPAPQTIDFAPFADQMAGGPPLTLRATASSGLPVAFTASTPSVCTIGGRNLDKLTLVGAGTCTVTADQTGDGNHLAAPSVPQSFTVSLGAATVTLTSDRATSVSGEAVKLIVTVAGATGQATGTITFMDGPVALATSPLALGKATLTIRTLGVGPHDISAAYSGDAIYAGATATLAGGLTVDQGTTKTTITNAKDLRRSASRVGEDYVVNVLVAAAPPSSGIPTGSVAFSDGTVSCTATLAADGTASCPLSATVAGTKTITVTYAGDPGFVGSSASVTHKVVMR